MLVALRRMKHPRSHICALNPYLKPPTENKMNTIFMDPIEEGINAAGTGFGYIPRPMLAF
jgi:hypothetical protein